MENKITIMTNEREVDHPGDCGGGSEALRALLVPLYQGLDFSQVPDYGMIEPKEGYPYPSFFQAVNGNKALEFFRQSGYDIRRLNCVRWSEEDRKSVLDESILTREDKDFGLVVTDTPGYFHEYEGDETKLRELFGETERLFALYPGLVDAWLPEIPVGEYGIELQEKLGIPVTPRCAWTADPSNGYDYSSFFLPELNVRKSLT